MYNKWKLVLERRVELSSNKIIVKSDLVIYSIHLLHLYQGYVLNTFDPSTPLFRTFYSKNSFNYSNPLQQGENLFFLICAFCAFYRDFNLIYNQCLGSGFVGSVSFVILGFRSAYCFQKKKIQKFPHF